MNSSSWHNIKPLCPISDLTHNGLVISNIFYILKQNIYFFEIFKFYHHFTNLKLQKIAPPHRQTKSICVSAFFRQELFLAVRFQLATLYILD